MTDTLKPKSAFSNPVYRPILQLVLAITTVLLISISLLVWTAWRNSNRTQPIHHHLKFLIELQQLQERVEEYQYDKMLKDSYMTGFRENLLKDIKQLIDSRKMLTHSTLDRLRNLYKNILKDKYGNQVDMSHNYRNSIQSAITEEINMHNAILLDMSRNIKFEFYLALSVTLFFTIGLIIFLYSFRNQILLPLHNLNGFISLLAERNYKTMPMDNIEPLLKPLFKNYNYMVNRLSELEEEHVNHRHILEKNIRMATGVLVEQQQTLARSERLAILGEFVAGIAHELRNPLAGIQMALVNFRQDLTSQSQKEQLDLVTSELSRISRLLNNILQQARHSPEKSITFSARELVSNLVTLTRYQMPQNISIQYDIQEDDQLTLPQEGLRQALLNLIVNASQAIDGEKGQIQLTINKNPTFINIVVQDNGPGFPQEMLGSNIQPFKTWKENGTGLGMAMVRRFVSNLNGELNLQNLTPHGALVSLKIPC